MSPFLSRKCPKKGRLNSRFQWPAAETPGVLVLHPATQGICVTVHSIISGWLEPARRKVLLILQFLFLQRPDMFCTVPDHCHFVHSNPSFQSVRFESDSVLFCDRMTCFGVSGLLQVFKLSNELTIHSEIIETRDADEKKRCFASYNFPAKSLWCRYHGSGCQGFH